MKRFFLILLALGISVCVIPLAIAKTPDGQTPAAETVCDGLEGAAFGLCNAYCEAQDCDLRPGKKSCESLRENYAESTGTDRFPCDPTACCFCSTGGQDTTGQECEQISEAQCAAMGGLSIGDFLCEEVSCTVESEDPGCLIVDNDPEDPIIPPCINGISEVILQLPFGCEFRPPFICTPTPLCTYLDGELMDESCPGVPLCEPQACCFEDGSCADLEDLEPLECTDPQGVGTTCATVECEQPPIP
jgi:hypothetical protein